MRSFSKRTALLNLLHLLQDFGIPRDQSLFSITEIEAFVERMYEAQRKVPPEPKIFSDARIIRGFGRRLRQAWSRKHT